MGEQGRPAKIHPTAVVATTAELGSGVVIGPHCVIGERVRIGDDNHVGPGTWIEGPTEIGPRNRFFGPAAVGTDPQDLKYRGEESFLVIGEGNLIREFVTIHRGTAGGGLYTRIGNRNLLMTGVHVAHDCVVGDNVILANSATLAGHVWVGNGASVGAFSGVHQFCRVGEHAFIGGYSVITRDALPYLKTVGIRGEAKTYGVNTVGLERKGFSREAIEALQHAYRVLLHRGLSLRDAVQRIRDEGPLTSEVEHLLRFVETSERGFIR